MSGVLILIFHSSLHTELVNGLSLSYIERVRQATQPPGPFYHNFVSLAHPMCWLTQQTYQPTPKLLCCSLVLNWTYPHSNNVFYVKVNACSCDEWCETCLATLNMNNWIHCVGVRAYIFQLTGCVYYVCARHYVTNTQMLMYTMLSTRPWCK